MDIGQEDKGKPLQRCLSFLPCSSKTSGAVSVMQIRVFFLVSPGRFLCSAFDHVFRSAASARHGPHGSSQSPAVVFARQGIQLSNFKSLHIPPFVKGKKKGFRGGVISFFRLFKSYPVLSVCPPCNGISLSLVKGKIMQFWVLHLLKIIRIVIFLPAGDSVVKIQVADDASAGVDTGFLPCGFEGLQPLLGVGLRQPQAAAVLVNLEAHLAAIDFRDPAELRDLLRKSPQPLFQIRVVGGDLHCGIGLVEVNLSEFLLLVQMLFLRKLVAFWLFRSGSRPGKESRFSDKSNSGDPLYHTGLLCRLISVFPGSRRENGFSSFPEIFR